jgi:hypothetical protein
MPVATGSLSLILQLDGEVVIDKAKYFFERMYAEEDITSGLHKLLLDWLAGYCYAGFLLLGWLVCCCWICFFWLLAICFGWLSIQPSSKLAAKSVFGWSPGYQDTGLCAALYYIHPR